MKSVPRRRFWNPAHRARAIAVLVSGLGVAVAGCDLPTDDRQNPTTISVTPSGTSFDAVADTLTFSAEVLDQDGAVMPDAAVEWSSSDPTVADIDQSGLVTSTGNGDIFVTATAGSASGDASVSVQQVPTAVEVTAGADQEGPAGEPLAEAVELRVLDPLGQPAEGVQVVFEVQSGSGSVEPEATFTGGDGTASTTWRLGEVAGETQRLRARVAPSGSSGSQQSDGDEQLAEEIQAFAVAGEPDALVKLAGDDQAAPRMTLLPQNPTVAVVDRFGNPVPDALVEWQIGSESGSVDPQSAMSDPAGEVSTRWTLGPTLGTQTVEASVAGIPQPAQFEATSVAVPAALELVSGDGQTGPAGSGLPDPLVVRVTDQHGNPHSGTVVQFNSGAGTVSPAQAISDGDGRAISHWSLGSTTGEQELVASVPGLPPVLFSATATEVGGGSPTTYDIELAYASPVSPAVEQAFDNAADRWSGIIIGDQPDVPYTLPANGFCQSPVEVDKVFDDLYVIVRIEPIDGPGGTLGSAGPCYVRSSNGLTIIGRMKFDEADVDQMLANGQFEDVVLHELAHVIGIGTLWDSHLGLLQDPANPSAPGTEDTHFTGPFALAAFEDAGGTGYSGGAKVPVENNESFGPGTYNGHWREFVLDNELMTGFIGSGSNPLSRVTAAALKDMGYEVNEGAADPYSLPLPGIRLFREERIRIEEELFGPVGSIDDSGNVTPVAPTDP